MITDPCSTIERACDLVAVGDLSGASRVVATEYPFQPHVRQGRTYTPGAMTGIFLRDGFIDRYRGQRLVFPPVLRLLSHAIPREFPYHKNGKMTEGHVAYWELFPTIDHVVPIARGGADDAGNWVTCSMLTNSMKANWTLDQLQWTLLPPGDVTKWDGLTGWFLCHVERNPTALEIPYVKRWHAALLAARRVHSGQTKSPSTT